MRFRYPLPYVTIACCYIWYTLKYKLCENENKSRSIWPLENSVCRIVTFSPIKKVLIHWYFNTSQRVPQYPSYSYTMSPLVSTKFCNISHSLTFSLTKVHEHLCVHHILHHIPNIHSLTCISHDPLCVHQVVQDLPLTNSLTQLPGPWALLCPPTSPVFQ